MRTPVLQSSPAPPGPWASRVASGRRLPHRWVSPEVSTLDLVTTGGYLIATADGTLGARASRAATDAGLPSTVALLEQPLMHSLGAELVIVRPDQVVSAVWRAPTLGPTDETEFLRFTSRMAVGPVEVAGEAIGPAGAIGS